jgi:hypothetical protein
MPRSARPKQVTRAVPTKPARQLSGSGPMEEKDLVRHLSAFLGPRETAFKRRKMTDEKISTEVDRYIQGQRLSPRDKGILKAALEIQCKACRNLVGMNRAKRAEPKASSSSGEGSVGLMAPSGDSGDLLVLVFIGAYAAASSLASTIYEVCKELGNSQRIGSNISTLATFAAVIVGGLLTVALCASNPVGWGIGALGVLVGAALLVKGARALFNSADAALSKGSALASDGRFQLTAKDELNLIKKGVPLEEMDKIKGAIRFLAMKAEGLEDHRPKEKEALIEQLTALKKGEFEKIPDLIRQFSIASPDTAESLPDSISEDQLVAGFRS